MIARAGLTLPLLLTVAWADVFYTVTPEPTARTLRVSIKLDEAREKETFSIPAWTPGFYFLQNYEKKISNVVATDPDGKTLRIDQPDGRSWTVQNEGKKPITLSYRVLGDDAGLGFFGVNVIAHTAFINGPAAFMYVQDRKEERCVVQFKLPAEWEVATGMPPAPGGVYVSENYDELADHPIQLGLFQRRSFTIDGIPFEAVYVSPNRQYTPNLDYETDRLRQVSKPAIRMFGGVPFKKYVYLVHLATGDFAGGLEHRASTVLAIANMPQLHIDDLAAHEFFHTWNVKHIRPKQLGPFDYTTKVRTGNLWFAEGVTDYYAKLHTYQSGLQNQNWLLRSLGLEIAELQASKTRSVKTLEDSSKEAWENGGFGVGDLSYYTKGQLVGLIFDAEIRSKTKGAKSLDDVLRYLYREHKLPKPGYPEEGLLKALEHISGLELKDLYRKMVSSTEELPYERLSALGLRVLKPGETVPRPGYRVDIGGVMDVGQEAYAQGLREGDVIVSINGVSMSSEGLGRIAPGERYRATVQRGGEEVQLTLTMGRFQNRIWQLILDPAAGPEALARRAEWLKVLED